MSEGGEQQADSESPLSRKEIELAKAEIKDLLGKAFRNTPLQDLFSEFQPPEPLQEESFRGLRRDYVGTRNISGAGNQRIDERELKVYLKPRERRRQGADVGQLIRLVEPGSGSSREPIIEHFTLEYGGGLRPTAKPNYQTTVRNALELAKAINKSR